MRMLTAILVTFASLAGSDAGAAQRTPLAPVELTKISYEPGGTRDRFNPVTKQWEKLALDRKIVHDEASGNFLLQWNGLDGKRKTIIYRPATHLHAVVTAKVEPDVTGSRFRYVYAIRNLPTSRRHLQSFYIETKADVDKPESPDATWGYSGPFTDYLMKVFQVKGGWDWAQTRNGRNGLLSGESSYGFSFRSTGLPALVKCYVAGSPGMKGVGEEPPEELMAALDPVLWLVPHGVTVGPVAAPENLDSVVFLNEVDAMVEIAVQQGWVLSPSLAQELRESLKSAVASLQQENSNGTVETLQGLLKRVEEEKEKALLSEAYALLKYNIEFLLSRLKPAS